MPKANNPGCACCGRVLIWDDGSATVGLDDPGAHGPGDFLDFSETKRWVDNGLDLPLRHEAAPGEKFSNVDFAFGSAFETDDDDPDPIEARAFYGYVHVDDGGGCDVPIPSATLFDPNTDGVDLGYWTGNINDYSLIIWRRPLSNDNLYQQFFETKTPPCNTDHISACDVTHNYPDTFQEPPSWLEEVMSGAWRGRLVLALDRGGDTDTLSDGLPCAMYVNELLAEMNLDMEVEIKHNYEGGATASCTTVYNVHISSAKVESLTTCTYYPYDWTSLAILGGDKPNVMEGVDELFSANGALPANNIIIFADEDLLTKNIPALEACSPVTQVDAEYGNVPPVPDETCAHAVNHDYRQVLSTIPANVGGESSATAARSLLVKTIGSGDEAVEVNAEIVVCAVAHVMRPKPDPAQGNYFDIVWRDEFDGLNDVATIIDDPLRNSMPPIADYLEDHEQFVRNLFLKPLMPPPE